MSGWHSGTRGSRFVLALLGIGLALAASASLSAQETLLQVRAFLTHEAGESPGERAITLYRSIAEPRLAAVKTMVNGTESDLRAAAAEAATKLRDIESLEYLFSVIFYWDGRSGTVGDFAIQPPRAFRFELEPSWNPGGGLDFRLAVYAKELLDRPPQGRKEEEAAQRALWAAIHPDFFKERMEKLCERQVSLLVEEPGLLFIPFHEATLILFLMPAVRPQPVIQALPVYPADLIRKGVAGRGRYRISIDKKGAVRKVEVRASVHPFLDAAAAEALRTWVFEPVTKALAAVGVSFDWTVDFDPSRWPGVAPVAASGSLEAPSPELEKLLGLGAAYCERLSAAALYFVCRELIRSQDYALNLPKRSAPNEMGYTQKKTDSGEIIGLGTRPAALSRDPFKTKTFRLSSDFQLIRKQGRIEERRVLLESSDKTARKGAAPPDEKRYAVLRPLFVPIDILGKDRQGFYRFRLIGREKALGRMTDVIEAVAKPGAPVRITRARIWIDPETSQVVRCETQGLPIEGYEFIFDEASLIGAAPLCTTTISYETEKNGILFPGRVKFLIEYPVNIWGVAKRTRIDTDIRYDQYRFFTVQTEKAVIRWPD